MAQEVNKNNIVSAGIPLSIKRENAIPLDLDSLHSNFTQATNYALTSGTAYLGNIISVYENENNINNGVYFVVSSNESPTGLIKLANANTLSEFVTVLNELSNRVDALSGTVSYQGTYDIFVKYWTDYGDNTNLKRGMIFSISGNTEYEIFKANFGTDKFSKTYSDGTETTIIIEAGDLLVINKDINDKNDLKASTFIEYVDVWKTDLTSAITKVTNGDSESGKYISALINNDGDLQVVKTKLPITGITGTGTATKTITGFNINDGVITPIFTPIDFVDIDIILDGEKKTDILDNKTINSINVTNDDNHQFEITSQNINIEGLINNKIQTNTIKSTDAITGFKIEEIDREDGTKLKQLVFIKSAISVPTIDPISIVYDGTASVYDTVIASITKDPNANLGITYKTIKLPTTITSGNRQVLTQVQVNNNNTVFIGNINDPVYYKTIIATNNSSYKLSDNSLKANTTKTDIKFNCKIYDNNNALLFNNVSCIMLDENINSNIFNLYWNGVKLALGRDYFICTFKTVNGCITVNKITLKDNSVYTSTTGYNGIIVMNSNIPLDNTDVIECNQFIYDLRITN